jgi:hypothetical protein
MTVKSGDRIRTKYQSWYTVAYVVDNVVRTLEGNCINIHNIVEVKS